MQKRIVIVVFIVTAAAIVLLSLNKGYFQSEQQEVVRPKLVIPNSEGESKEASAGMNIVPDDLVMTSLVSLNPDETLIDVVSADFSGDGFEDQAIVVRKANNPKLQLAVGIYDSTTEAYERAVSLSTEAEQVKTFSCYGLDLTGKNRNALVYQGFDSSGNSVLRAYFITHSEAGGEYSLQMLADLKSNGAIYLQQEDEESYSGTGNSPYDIMVYSSELSGHDSSDQLQTIWSWSERAQKYVQSKQTKIKGSSIKKGELAKIQDGTVKTFADYLNGLWYRTEGNGGGVRYVFFDYESGQIIFLLGDEEEVYNWQNSTLHYRGMHISTSNFEIENLKRSVDVSLIDLEQIGILVHDDVSMVIKEENSWNGDYKKLKFSDFYSESFSSSSLNSSYINNLEAGPRWKMSDGSIISFSGGSYTSHSGEKSYSGSYISMQLEGDSFIQFKLDGDRDAENADGGLSGYYLASYPPSADDGSKIDEDRIILQPYTVHLNDTSPSSGHPLILTREKDSNQ